MNVSKFILFLAIFGIIGCNTIKPKPAEWRLPSREATQPVKFIQKDNGLWIDEKSSKNLLKNIENEDAYVEKLEALIKEMKEYHGDK